MDSIGNGSAFQAVPEQLKTLHGWMASGGGVDGKAPTDAQGYDASRAVADVWRSFEAVVDEDHKRGCGIELALAVSGHRQALDLARWGQEVALV